MIGVARDRERLARWEAEHPGARGVVADVTRDRAVIFEGLERLDILVNNAGTNIRKKAVEYEDAEYVRIRETNMDSVFDLCRRAYPLLRAAGDASVVNVASVAAFRHLGTGLPYAMTKAAVEHMTRGLAAEWARDGIRVNAVAPWHPTPLAEPVLTTRSAREDSGHHAAGLIEEPEEVVSVVAFLVCRPPPTLRAKASPLTADSAWPGFSNNPLANRPAALYCAIHF